MNRPFIHAAFFGMMAVLATIPAHGQIDGDFSGGGAIRIGTSTTICDGDAEGGLRWNSVSKKVEVCDGTAWGELASANGASSDTTPDAFSFTDLTNHSLGAIALSETLNITGFDGPLIAEVSGSGTPQISINGGAFITAGSINPGDSLRVRMTSSVSVSTANVATVTVGTVTDNWSVTTKAGQTQILVTNITVVGGSIGGLAGADGICQTDAANRGFAGTWKALMSDETTNAKDRVTIVYPVIRATDGLTVDTTDLFDGNLDTNTTIGGSGFTWTGSNTNGTKQNGNTCDSWTNTATTGRDGQIEKLNSQWINDDNNESCTNTRKIYCVDQ